MIILFFVYHYTFIMYLKRVHTQTPTLFNNARGVRKWEEEEEEEIEVGEENIISPLKK